MRHITTILIILFSTLISFGQDTTGIKTVKKYQGKKIRLISNYDKNGNCYFTKNDGLNGPVIMIWGIDFDKLNRETRSIWAHSNVGFSISEKKYEPNLIKTYEYTLDTINQNAIVLFDFASPSSLRKSIHHVFFNYLLEKDKVFPKDFETIVSDFYFLIMFLQEAEDAMAGKPAPSSDIKEEI